MKGYLAILSARFRTLLQYRAAALAGAGTNIFWGFIRLMIFEAFYRSAPGPHPMSFPETLTYIWLGQAALTLILWRPDQDVRNLVRTGGVAYELLRPLDLYALWFTRSIAAATAPAPLRISVVIVVGAFFGLGPPASAAAAAAWLASTLVAIILSCALATLISISLLWTVSGEGVSRLMPVMGYTLSGMLVPIPLFPDWARPVLDFLPFRGLIDVPFRLYLGHIPPEQAAGVLAHQIAWAAGLVLLGRWVLSRGLRRVVVQGG